VMSLKATSMRSPDVAPHRLSPNAARMVPGMRAPRTPSAAVNQVPCQLRTVPRTGRNILFPNSLRKRNLLVAFNSLFRTFESASRSGESRPSNLWIHRKY
jgi:hypothetical protein